MPENDPAPATGAAAGATPAQTTPVSPAPAASSEPPEPPATGEGALGDAGKQALQRMKEERDADRAARKTLEGEIAALKAAGLSEAEKAIKAAEDKGRAEASAKLSQRIRASEVRAALISAGVNTDLLDLAVRAPVFDSVKVTDEGEIDGLDAAMAAVKTANPTLFTRPATPGSADGGFHGTPPGLTREAIARMTPAEYEKNREHIHEAMAKGTIT